MKPTRISQLTGSALVERFVQWRHGQGLTQQKAADRLEISVATVRAYECGNRTPNGENTTKILAVIGALQTA